MTEPCQDVGLEVRVPGPSTSGNPSTRQGTDETQSLGLHTNEAPQEVQGSLFDSHPPLSKQQLFCANPHSLGQS